MHARLQALTFGCMCVFLVLSSFICMVNLTHTTSEAGEEKGDNVMMEFVAEVKKHIHQAHSGGCYTDDGVHGCNQRRLYGDGEEVENMRTNKAHASVTT